MKLVFKKIKAGLVLLALTITPFFVFFLNRRDCAGLVIMAPSSVSTLHEDLYS